MFGVYIVNIVIYCFLRVTFIFNLFTNVTVVLFFVLTKMH
jgi:hypothetical protein